MEYRTPDGELTGFDIDLGNALCAEVGIQCEWVVQGWDGIIPGLMARKYDAIMSSMTINDERREPRCCSLTPTSLRRQPGLPQPTWRWATPMPRPSRA